MNRPLLEARNVTKTYPGVTAVREVSLAVHSGEVLGLVGENGSGKSTLLKMLAGWETPTGGDLFLDGVPAQFPSPAHALEAGIALVAQEILVQDHLTVAENLLDGRMPRGRLRLIDWRRAEAEARRILESVGLQRLDPRALVGGLAAHDQQMIAILKVVERRPRIVLFDEPTSSLTAAEVDEFSSLVAALKDAGSAIVFITHRLHEYFDLTDRIVVLRDGVFVGEYDTAALDEDDLVRLMVGRQIERLFQRPPGKDERTFEGPPVLRLRNLRTRTLRGIDLDVHAGEIVGIAGQAGSGRSSLAGTIFGRWPYEGTLSISGEEKRLTDPASAIRAGVALVPEDRRREGLVGMMTVADNLVMASWHRSAIRASRRDLPLAQRLREAYTIKTSTLASSSASLSGGNQQKIVLAKWAPQHPRILILDEPTRGVDVGAKAELYALIEEQAAAGVAVIVLSSELLEVLRLADRVVVMAEGGIVGELPGSSATESAITALSFASTARSTESEVAA